jgi:hypothetical protein
MTKPKKDEARGHYARIKELAGAIRLAGVPVQLRDEARDYLADEPGPRGKKLIVADEAIVVSDTREVVNILTAVAAAIGSLEVIDEGDDQPVAADVG